MKLKYYGIMGVVAVLAFLGALVWSHRTSSVTPAKTGLKHVTVQRGVSPRHVIKNGARPVVTQGKSSFGNSLLASPKPVLNDDDESFSPADKTLAHQLQDALDAEDLKGVLAIYKNASESANPAIRQRMVSALSWFGEKALPELTPFMADADEDVRDDAQQQWSSALSEVEDDRQRAEIVEAAMNVLTDRDTLDQIVSELNSVPNDIAVSTLVRIITSGNATAAVSAREAYEFITGDEYTDANAAQQWLQENQDEDMDPGVPPPSQAVVQ